MAHAELQPIHGPGAPLFEWAPGIVIEDDDQAPVLQDVQHVQDHIEIIGEGHEMEYIEIDEDFYQDELDPDEQQHDEIDQEVDARDAEAEIAELRSANGNDSDDAEETEDEQEGERQSSGLPTDESTEEEQDDDDSNEMPDEVPELFDRRTETQIRHNLRPNRERSYNNRLGHIMDEPANTQS
jgi:hypothetical protein